MAANEAVLQAGHWDAQYRAGPAPWDTGRPSPELRRVVAAYRVRPCRAVELGCGTGTNAVWLARQGFAVTAVDISPHAVRRGRRWAAAAGVRVHFLAADLTAPGVLRGPFDFFFDRGCYHAVRLADAGAYLRTLERVTRPGALGLVLTGNAAEPEDEDGPPVLDERQLRAELGRLFDIVRLRPFRFDAPGPGDRCYLGWSCLLRRPGLYTAVHTLK
jgi:SAM-dependent methyltransferase